MNTVSGAAAIEHHQCVHNAAIRRQVIHQRHDARLIAGQRVAGANAHERIRDHAVVVVDYGDRKAGGVGLNIGRHIDGGDRGAIRRVIDIHAVHIFGKRSAASDGHVSRGHV